MRLHKDYSMQELEKITRYIINHLYSNCDVHKVYINEDNVYTIEIVGGHNGNGEWEKYFADLSVIVSALKTYCENVWLIDLNVDVLDDIWYAYLGIR